MGIEGGHAGLRCAPYVKARVKKQVKEGGQGR